MEFEKPMDFPVQLTLPSAMEQSVVSALLSQNPQLEEELRRARTCIVEYTHWPDGDPDHRDDDWETALEKVAEGVVGQAALETLPQGVQPVLLCYLRVELAKRLAGRPLQVAGIPILGWMGIYEGGTDFLGADGSIVRSEDWVAAKEVLVRWCRQRWMN